MEIKKRGGDRWDRWQELLGDRVGARDDLTQEEQVLVQQIWGRISPVDFEKSFATREKLNQFLAMLDNEEVSKIPSEILQKRIILKVLRALSQTEETVHIADVDEAAWFRAA